MAKARIARKTERMNWGVAPFLRCNMIVDRDIIHSPPRRGILSCKNRTLFVRQIGRLPQQQNNGTENAYYAVKSNRINCLPFGKSYFTLLVTVNPFSFMAAIIVSSFSSSRWSAKALKTYSKPD